MRFPKLKNGYIVITKNDNRYMVVDDYLVNQNGGFNKLEIYKDSCGNFIKIPNIEIKEVRESYIIKEVYKGETYDFNAALNEHNLIFYEEPLINLLKDYDIVELENENIYVVNGELLVSFDNFGELFIDDLDREDVKAIYRRGETIQLD